MTELRLAKRPRTTEVVGATTAALQTRRLPLRQHVRSCEHRTVSREGRIICQRIAEGDPEVSPNVCRDCPFRQVDCTHLRFSLRITTPSPLLVRFNGRTEVWDDGPPRLAFARAACAERAVPIRGPHSCGDCPLRTPLGDEAAECATSRSPAAVGKVVPFPAREAALAAG